MSSKYIAAAARGVGRQELLEREVLEIADREKQHLGRELHDGLCQSLAGLAALSLALSRSLAANGQPGPAAAADEIVRLLNETIVEARDLAHGLGAIGLNGAGLVGGIETLARNVRNTYRASCTFSCDSGCPDLRDEAQAHLVRIAQEAVRNSIAHGRRKTCAKVPAMPTPIAEPARPARKTLLVVDDHPVLRRGLTALIESEPDLAVGGPSARASPRSILSGSVDLIS